MKNLTNRTILISWLLPIVVLIGYLLFSGLNLGVDYASANVITFQTVEDKTSEEVRDAVSSIRSFSKISSLEGNSFQVYFQNVSLEELGSMEDEIATELGEIVDFQVLTYKPATLIFITDRIIYALYVIVVTYMVLLALRVKGSGITREKLVWFLLTEFLAVVSVLLVLMGTINVISILGIQITVPLITFALAILFLGLMLNVFLTRDMSLKPSSRVVSEVFANVEKFKKLYLKYYLLLALLLLSVLFADMQHLTLVILGSVVVLYCVFVFLRLKPLMLEWFIANSKKHNPFVKSKFFSREW